MYVWNFYSIRHRRQVTRNVIQCVSFYVLEDKNYVIIVVNVSININSPCFPILHSSINQLSSYKTRLTLNYNHPDEVVNETTGCGMLLYGLLCSLWSVSKLGISFILEVHLLGTFSNKFFMLHKTILMLRYNIKENENHSIGPIFMIFISFFCKLNHLNL